MKICAKLSDGNCDPKNKSMYINPDGTTVCSVHMDRTTLQKNCGHTWADDGIRRSKCSWCGGRL